MATVRHDGDPQESKSRAWSAARGAAGAMGRDSTSLPPTLFSLLTAPLGLYIIAACSRRLPT